MKKAFFLLLYLIFFQNISAQKIPEFYIGLRLHLVSTFYTEPKLYNDGTFIGLTAENDTAENFMIPMPLIGIHLPIYKNFGIKAGLGYQRLKYDMLLDLRTTNPVESYEKTVLEFHNRFSCTELLLYYRSNGNTQVVFDNSENEWFSAEIGLLIFRNIGFNPIEIESNNQYTQAQNNFVNQFPKNLKNEMYGLHTAVYYGIKYFEIGLHLNFLWNEFAPIDYPELPAQSHQTYRFFIGGNIIYMLPFNK
jgi:hypothetical protein